MEPRPSATKRVIALAVSDLHLSHRPPIARSSEKSWYGVMERYTDQLWTLKNKHNCPVLVAGDLFDHWNEPAELTNFIIKILRPFDGDIYAIHGQHDTPFHRGQDLHRSAFWTLVESEIVKYLTESEWLRGNLHVKGFSWGTPLTKNTEKEKDRVSVAVIHHYVWRDGHSHPGAKEEDHVENVRKQLQEFDVVVSGDNHSPFISNSKLPVMLNCGTFLRRKSDEIKYCPQVGLIHDDGSVSPHYLDTSEDVFLRTSELAKIIKEGVDVSQFLEELNQLGDKAINFREAVEECLRSKEIREEVATIVLKAMEKQ